MKVKIKKNKNGEWAMVETFQVYRYGNSGAITITGIVNTIGELTGSYVYRKEDFIPASQIEEEMGIEKYLNAKKPFYMKLSDGFVVKVRAAMNFSTRACDFSKSSCELYKVIGKEMGVTTGQLTLTRILEIPETLSELQTKLIKDVAECNGNRLEYIKSRF